MASALFLPPFQARAQEEKWLLSSADVRVKLEIEDQPSVPEAGIIAIVPNGGLLPQPIADFVVFDPAGKELKSECVWNNPREGIGIVFEPTKAEGQVSIYFKSASALRPWMPKSDFRPSLLLYTETGKRSILDAKSMSNKTPPATGGRMGQVTMVADRQNRFGPSEGYISYYSGWLNVPKDGPIYYGTVSSDGSVVLIDGKTVAEWPGEHSYTEKVPGEHGRSVALGKGPHRFEYLHFSANQHPQTQFIWRLPESGNGPYDTPSNNDFVRSGSAKIVAAETRLGAPLAMFDKTAIKYAGYTDAWIDLFELTVPLAEKYASADASWELGDKHTAKGMKVLWPVVRGTLPKARLTLKDTHGTTVCSRVLYLDALPPGTKVDDADDRAVWQEALYNLVKGAPHRSHVADDWPPCFWEMLPEIVEPGEAEELLGELIDHSADEWQTLPQEARGKLEDIYFQEIVQDHDKAAAFLTKTISSQKDPGRRVHWQIMQIDFYLFEIGDLKTARRLADQFQGGVIGATPADAALRQVQRGDIERIDGDLDRALQFYATAQQEYRRAAADSPGNTAMGNLMASRPASTPKPQSASPDATGMAIGAAKGTQTDWRVRTVRQNAFFSRVNNLLDQYFITEAKQALDEWAVEFPFSKLNGDYALAEGRYYALIGNDARAVRILKAYRKQTEISNELPPAMELELRCLAELGRKEDLKELSDDIKKRFPDLQITHMAAQALEGTPLPAPHVPHHDAVKE